MRLYEVERRVRRRRLRRRRSVAAGGAVVLLLVGGAAAHAVLQSGHVVDGVTIGGVDVGGDDAAQARAAIQRELAPRLDSPITIRADGISAFVIPSKLGIRLDAAESVRLAMGLGRLRGALFPFGYHAAVTPVLRLPATFTTPAAFAAATKPPVNARLLVAADGTGTIVPGRAGTGFAPHGALAAIGAAAMEGRTTVRLRTQWQAPGVTTATARRAEARLQQLIGAPIVLSRAGNQTGALQPNRLRALVSAHPAGRTISVAFDPAKVARELRPLLRDVVRPARDATWKAAGTHAVLLGSRRGIALDAKATAQHMTAAGLIADPQRRIAKLGFMIVRPTLTTKDARALKVTDRVGTFTSDMGASSANRIFNVHLMADMLDGRLIHPGQTFSFNQFVGPRTAARGFLEGQAIENGVLVPSIGGGVCQVATTIFNAAYWAGYPIVERHNHSFYISHYPLGMDATVADGGPDFAFRNDTRNPILIKTSYTDQTLTVSLYSAPTHRTVTSTTGTPGNYANPTTEYRYDTTTTPEGAIVQQTSGERGFDVGVTRTIKYANGTTTTATFPSHYVPENIIYFVGHGAIPPAGVTVIGAPPGALGTPPTKKPKHQGQTGTTTTGTGTTSTTGTGTTGTTTSPAGTTTSPTGTNPTGTTGG
jgi:vancomycin resistance protein YoaR